MLVARRLASWAARSGCDRLLAIAGGAAPENFTGEIVRFRPDLVVLVDAAHLGVGPGAVEAIPPERIGGLSFSTHMLPAPIFLDYLVKMTGCRTVVIGIDIAGKEVLAKVSRPVERAVRRIVAGVRGVVEGAG